MTRRPTAPSWTEAGAGAPDEANLYEHRVVTHDGVALTFARQKMGVGADGHDPVYYRFHRTISDASGEGAWSSWTELDLDAALAEGVRVVGADLITLPPPLLPRLEPVDPGTSCIAVVSADDHVVVVRRSTRGTLLVNRFLVVQRANDPTRGSLGEEVAGGGTAEDGAAVSEEDVVLVPATEARYRRSGSRDVPRNETDSFGTTDMVGRPFREPVLELLEVVESQNFRGASHPDRRPDGRRLVAFVSYTSSPRPAVRVVSYPSGDDGLFGTSPSVARLGRTEVLLAPTVARGVDGDVPLTFRRGAPLSAAIYFQRQPLGSRPDAPSPPTPQPPTPPTIARRAARLMVVAFCTLRPTAGESLATVVYDLPILGSGAPTSQPTITLEGAPRPIDGELTATRYTANLLAGEAAYPVRREMVHPLGIAGDDVLAATSYSAQLLGQVHLGGRPAVLDSADGLVHVYYREYSTSSSGRLRAVQFDPSQTAGSRLATWRGTSREAPVTGTLRFVADQPGTAGDAADISIMSVDELFSDLLGLRIGVADSARTHLTSDVERWSGLPSDTAGFLSALTGRSSVDPAGAGVQSGRTRFFDYTGTQDTIRLPLRPVGSSEVATGWMDLVSRLTPGMLRRFSVAPGDGGPTVQVVFTSPLGGDVNLTWRRLPTAPAELLGLFRGDQGTDYDFIGNRDPADGLLFAVPTDGRPVLVHVPASAGYTTTAFLTMVAGESAGTVTLGLHRDGNDDAPVTWTELPTSVVTFAPRLAAALRTSFPGAAVLPPVWGARVTVLGPSTRLDIVTLRDASILIAAVPPLVDDPLRTTTDGYPGDATTPIRTGRYEVVGGRPVAAAAPGPMSLFTPVLEKADPKATQRP